MRRLRVVAAASALGLALAGSSSAQAPSAPSVEVTMPGKAYAPPELSVLVGTTVTWHNADVGNHTVTADDESFDSGYIGPGAAFSWTFARPGTYKFHCSIHRFMKGVVRAYSLVIAGPEHPLRAGTRAVFTGLAPVGSRSVTLEQRLAVGRWGVVARRPPRPDGSYQFTIRASAPGTYRTRVRTASRPIRVRVAPKVETVASGRRLAVSTAPARPGARVALQAYDRERFMFFTVARASLDATGRIAIAIPRLPSRHVRVVVRGTRGWSDGASRVIRLRR